MDSLEVEQLKQRLLRQKAELQQLVESSVDETQPVGLDQTRFGRLSRMDALQAKEMAEASQRRRQRQLVQIEGALRRIEAGDYGHCFVCGGNIGMRRLAADPTNTRCIRCAQTTGGSP